MNDKIVVLDMAPLFRKKIMLYSFGDMHFNTPVSITYLMYLAVLMGLWTYPVFKIFNAFNVYSVMTGFGVPFLLAGLLSKNIWGGKTFLSFMSTQVSFMFSPKLYCDLKPCNRRSEVKTVEHTYSVSRLEDFYKLFTLRKKEWENG